LLAASDREVHHQHLEATELQAPLPPCCHQARNRKGHLACTPQPQKLVQASSQNEEGRTQHQEDDQEEKSSFLIAIDDESNPFVSIVEWFQSFQGWGVVRKNMDYGLLRSFT
jgi:hypothetical protein